MKSYHDIAGDGGSRILEQVQDHAARLAENLSRVKFVLAVASGKGGVGKSSVSAGLALAWARQGLSVGLLDADLHGSSVARLLGMTGLHLSVPPSSRPAPQLGPEGIRVFSMDFLQDPAGPVRWKNVPGGDEFVWRTTLEMSLLREFLTDVEWGRLDVLLLDLPPGGDR
jgi:ATP-binding protein involved in chromosome partitioning